MARFLVCFSNLFVNFLIIDRFFSLELPQAIAHYQQAGANYTALSALTINARQQVFSSIKNVANILSTTAEGPARLFPSHMGEDSIVAACDLLDLVEDPTFESEEDTLMALASKLGPEVFKNIFAQSREEAEASVASALMDVSPPRTTPLENVQSPQITPPPLKRMRSSHFPLPAPMEARTISQGEASTSSVQSSQGGSRKRKNRT